MRNDAPIVLTREVLTNDTLRAASQGAFEGSDIALDGHDVAGCSARQCSEPGEAGVHGSIPWRSTNPIVLTRDEHIRHIASYWRQKDADRLRDEVLYDDVLCAVQLAMVEPQPRRDWSAARDVAYAVALNYAGLAFGGLVLFEMLRP